VSNLQRRVESLEDGQGPCPWCGHDPLSRVRYEVIWEDEEGAPRESSPPCSRCGNQDVLVLGWPDLPTEPPIYERHGVPDYPPVSWGGDRASEASGGGDPEP
jgi:hypothetical protein